MKKFLVIVALLTVACESHASGKPTQNLPDTDSPLKVHCYKIHCYKDSLIQEDYCHPRTCARLAIGEKPSFWMGKTTYWKKKSDEVSSSTPNLESTPYTYKQIEAVLLGAIKLFEKADLEEGTVKYHKKKFELQGKK